jgi:hypothetical protein
MNGLLISIQFLLPAVEFLQKLGPVQVTELRPIEFMLRLLMFMRLTFVFNVPLIHIKPLADEKIAENNNFDNFLK